MAKNYTMIEWLSSALDSVASESISLDIVHRSDDLLLAVLVSPRLISDRSVAIRKYVVLGIDKHGGQISVNDVVQDFYDYYNQFGVIELLLISDGKPDEDVRNLLRELQIRFVKLQGDSHTAPTPKVLLSFMRILWGDLFVEEHIRALENVKPEPTKIVRGKNAENLLWEIYKLIISLSFAEQELLTNSEHRWNFGRGTDGKVSSFAGSYAVQRRPVGDQWIDCYMPDRSYIALAMNRASTAYQTLMHIEVPPDYAATHSLLRDVSFQFVRYFASWLSGRLTGFELRHILSGLNELKEARHIRLLSRQIGVLEPLEQIESLKLLSRFGAVGATQDIIELLPQCTWKVQEACLQALERLETCHDPTEVQDYLFSRRESVQNAALRLIGRMGGVAATRFLVQLKDQNRINLSESLIEAIENTRTPMALGFLLRLLDDNKDYVPRVLTAIEECLDHVPAYELKRYQDQKIDQSWQISVCERLLKKADEQSHRIALRLVGTLKLCGGLPLVARALESESIRTRLSAIEAAANFPDDETVRLIVHSVERKPDDYENKKFIEYMTAMIERQRGGASDNLRSADDLSLDNTAVRALRQIGTPYALEHAARIIESSPGYLPRLKIRNHRKS